MKLSKNIQDRKPLENVGSDDISSIAVVLLELWATVAKRRAQAVLIQLEKRVSATLLRK